MDFNLLKRPLTQFGKLLQFQTLRHKRIWATLTLLTGLVFSLPLYQVLRWNLANVLLNHARLADSPIAMYEDAHLAQQLLTPFTSINATRIQLTEHLLWRAASALDKSTEGLSLYAKVFTATETIPTNLSVDCLEDFPQMIEASAFEGVEANSLAAPRYIQNSPYLGVILFSGSPISHQICVEEPGIYTIQITAVEGTPPPIEIALIWNNMYVGTLNYDQGNELLATKTLYVAIPMGNHTLTLNYTNDYADKATGVDRNALIDHIEIIGP